ncbi:Uncharacterised protein [Mycobacteroides abscessus]|nr:Uncharacterised protein [Mycobacteroides abscessus]
MHFTGVWIGVRVGSVPTGEGAIEIAGSDGVEVFGEFVIGDPPFDEGERASGVA